MLLRTEVSKDTYDLLWLLKITPQRSEVTETIEKYKETLSWIIEHQDGKKTELLAFSGEADPRIWNGMEEELGRALSLGMKYTHVIGPIVCTDENHKSSILELYKEYPKNVNLYLTRTRKPYHWIRFTQKTGVNNEFLFRLHGECHHEPLALFRKGFSICLENKNDAFFFEKVAYWYNRERDFEWLTPIMDKVSDVHQVPTLTFEELRIVYDKMKKAGIDFDVETSEEITSFLH